MYDSLLKLVKYIKKKKKCRLFVVGRAHRLQPVLKSGTVIDRGQVQGACKSKAELEGLEGLDTRTPIIKFYFYIKRTHFSKGRTLAKDANICIFVFKNF